MARFPAFSEKIFEKADAERLCENDGLWLENNSMINLATFNENVNAKSKILKKQIKHFYFCMLKSL